jgi:hypothetical protein
VPGLTINTRTKPGVLHAVRGALGTINMHAYSICVYVDTNDNAELPIVAAAGDIPADA